MENIYILTYNNQFVCIEKSFIKSLERIYNSIQSFENYHTHDEQEVVQISNYFQALPKTKKERYKYMERDSFTEQDSKLLKTLKKLCHFKIGDFSIIECVDTESYKKKIEKQNENDIITVYKNPQETEKYIIKNLDYLEQLFTIAVVQHDPRFHGGNHVSFLDSYYKYNDVILITIEDPFEDITTSSKRTRHCFIHPKENIEYNLKAINDINELFRKNFEHFIKYNYQITKGIEKSIVKIKFDFSFILCYNINIIKHRRFI